MSTKIKFDYVQIWHTDKEGIIKTMVSNLNDDVQSGYPWLSSLIQRQLNEVTAYTINYEREASILSSMTSEAQQKWCKRDLIKRGVIS